MAIKKSKVQKSSNKIARKKKEEHKHDMPKTQEWCRIDIDTDDEYREMKRFVEEATKETVEDEDDEFDEMQKLEEAGLKEQEAHVKWVEAHMKQVEAHRKMMEARYEEWREQNRLYAEERAEDEELRRAGEAYKESIRRNYDPAEDPNDVEDYLTDYYSDEEF